MNFEALTEFYFTDLLLVICNFLALLASRKFPVTQNLKFIRLYIEISFWFNFAIYIVNIIFKPSRILSLFDTAVVSIYMLVEWTLLTLFFRLQTNPKHLKQSMTLCFFVFVALWAMIYIFHPKFLLDQGAALAGVESFAIILFGFISLQSKLKEARISDFIKSPEFYIFIGVIGYFSFSIPYFLCRLILGRVDQNIVPVFECLNLLIYSAFFLTIKKGFHVLHQK